MQLTVTKEQAIELIEANLARVKAGVEKTIEAVNSGKFEDAEKYLKGIGAIINSAQKNLEEACS
jgi:hypothetical protein